MNPMLIKQGLSIASQIRSAMKENKLKNQRTVYDQLRESSANTADLRDYLRALDAKDRAERDPEEAEARITRRAAAGPIVQGVRVRLENARDQLRHDSEAADSFDLDKAKRRLNLLAEDVDEKRKKAVKKLKPLRAKAKKRSARVEKAANKARARAEKKVRKQAATAKKRAQRRSRSSFGAGKTFGLISLLAAIAGAIYWFLLRKPAAEEADATPPRVEEHSGEKSATLVYSSTTEDDSAKNDSQDTPKETRKDTPRPAGELAEDPAERDEELLGSIDEQLEAHRRSEDAVAEASTGADDAAEALREEAAKAQREFDAKYGDGSK
ncbi:hypothetical protein [Corynebacterium tapiri]|uniref:Uncharacterized protein n=1 Tax=Corynebacterium tapiri TaxID=1448266 RepID=A0A5C4U4P3_9CORY|nr:hypothetical protein [Corynebacterium tapiri]TNL96846.1 hypothetical protein FHE74_07450 [Corynebacterium tapiri]